MMTDRQKLTRYLGSMQQEAYVRPVTLDEGRAGGLRTVEMKNGLMTLQVLAGKGMDLGAFTYAGRNLSFLSKPGLQGRNQYDTNGDEAIYSIMGGMMFTAGLQNICAPCTLDGTDYPMHGRIRTTPAEHLCCDAAWRDGRYELTVSGELREAALFGPNLVLRRRIRTVYGTKTVEICDEIENEGFRDEPLMLLYHINAGYPLLDERAKIYIPTRKVTARDEDGRGHEAEYDRMDPPKDNEPEYVFIHDVEPDEDGLVTVMVVNRELGLGLQISYTAKHLPYFMEWKSTASGDYVIGLEPSNSSVYGRPWHEERGDLHRIAPFTKETNILRYTVLDGAEEIDEAVRRFEAAVK